MFHSARNVFLAARTGQPIKFHCRDSAALGKQVQATHSNGGKQSPSGTFYLLAKWNMTTKAGSACPCTTRNVPVG